MKAVIGHLRRAALLYDGGGLSDGQLLESFNNRRDQAAFEALVRRHGPMVLGVCLRVLGNRHDAEDAFQATFLVLVRKAAALRSGERVGNWLYGVAYRTARRARAMSARRRQREREAAARSGAASTDEETWQDLLPRLDQELSRLPDKYRVAVVLCDLEGKSRQEVAGLLQIPEGTLSSRLAYARKRLAQRLSRPGLVLSAGALVGVLCPQAVSARLPGPLVVSTTRAALGQTVAAAKVLTLTEGVVKSMFLTKLKVVWALVLAVVVGGGAVGLAYRAAAADPKKVPDGATAARGHDPAALDELDALRLEIEALRKGLQATRARVKVLEAEVRALRGTRTGRQSIPRLTGTDEFLKPVENFKRKLPPDPKARPATDPLLGVEDAAQNFKRSPTDPRAIDRLERALLRLKQHHLRRHPDDKEAADLLDRALQQLKKQKRPPNEDAIDADNPLDPKGRPRKKAPDPDGTTQKPPR